MRNSCVFYRSFYEAGKELDIDQRAMLYDAIFAYSLDFEEPEVSGVVAIMFKLIKPQLDANATRYTNGCKAKHKRNEAKDKRNKAKISEPQANDNVNENDNDNVNENENEKEQPKPTHIFPAEVKNMVDRYYDVYLANQEDKYQRYFKKEGKRDKDYDVVEKLHKLDRYSYKDIHDILGWGVTDTRFWHDQLLSLSGLRKRSKSNNLTKFNNLEISFQKFKRGEK